jgi:hypothetical protein
MKKTTKTTTGAESKPRIAGSNGARAQRPPGPSPPLSYVSASTLHEKVEVGDCSREIELLEHNGRVTGTMRLGQGDEVTVYRIEGELPDKVLARRELMPKSPTTTTTAAAGLNSKKKVPVAAAAATTKKKALKKKAG